MTAGKRIALAAAVMNALAAGFLFGSGGDTHLKLDAYLTGITTGILIGYVMILLSGRKRHRKNVSTR